MAISILYSDKRYHACMHYTLLFLYCHMEVHHYYQILAEMAIGLTNDATAWTHTC